MALEVNKEIPQVSIIMPVYNAAGTVSRMVDSILAQSFRDWELIAVDDGSTDDSGRILDKYGEADSRIKVIHKSNGGVASARQTGIEKAHGLYTIHADSDDWVEPTMLEDMFAKAEEDEADIVISDYFTDVPGQFSHVVRQEPESTEPIEVLKALYAKGLFGGLWHKLIKKSAYDKAQAQFEPGINYCEDLLVLTKIIALASPKIVYMPKAYYHYVVNSNSLTQRVTLNGLESMKRFHLSVIRYLPDDDWFRQVSDDFALKEFIVLFMNYLYEDNRQLSREYKKIKSFIPKSYGKRWKLGFWCIEHGFVGIAHKLLKF